MVAQLGRRQITEALASISGTFFGVFYVGWLLSHAVVLRNFHTQVVSRYGPEAAVATSVTPDSGASSCWCTAPPSVVLCDAGAYFAGRAYGQAQARAVGVSPARPSRGRSAE